MTEIVTVRTRRDRGRFIDYAYDRNRDDPHWVPPLRIAERERLSPKKNPFFAHADVEMLLAVQDDQVVGRVLAIDDRLHNEAHGDNVAAFGFFEAKDSASCGSPAAARRSVGAAAAVGLS